jgi:hypothetical protein
MSQSIHLNAVAAAAVSQWQRIDGKPFSVQAVNVGSGTMTATVKVEVCNDADPVKLTGGNPITLATITLNAATPAVDGFAAPAAGWGYVRANATAVGGTTPALTVTVGT